MKEIKNVLICGLGAVGSIFAQKISKNFDGSLRVLFDEERLQKYLKTPPIFNGEVLRIEPVTPAVKTGGNRPVDLIIIATKYNGLREAVKNIENFVGEDTIIISLLNGVTSEGIIAEKYGWGRVLYSYFLGHSSVREGSNIKCGDVNLIVFGSENSKDVLRLKNFFDKTGIDYRIPDDIKRAMWLKFMLNVSCNQASAVFRMNFGQMTGNRHVFEFIQNIMKEVAAVAHAAGINNTETMLAEGFEDLKLMAPEGRTSMLQDIEACRKTEVEMFAGTVIDFGKKYGVQTPYNQVLKEIIEAVEESYSTAC